MKSGLARNLLFVFVGMLVALCLSIKLLYGVLLLLVLAVVYGWWIQTIYRQLNAPRSPIEGLLPTELEAAQIYYKRAQHRWEQGDYGGALGDFERAIADEHCLPEVYYYYGLLLLETGNAIDALRRLEEASDRARRNQETQLYEKSIQTISRLRRKFPQLAHC